MALYSDSDTSSESGYDLEQDSTSEMDEDSDNETLEPERDAPEEFENTPWNPTAQLHTTQLDQLHARQLAQLHAEIKARAELPDPSYPKLPRRWPFRLFDVRTLPDHVRSPIHYFELFWTLEVWDSLVQNTNAYAQYKEARGKGNKSGKLRWWKATTLYEMRVFIAILIYIGIIGASNAESFWAKDSNTIHKPMKLMSFYQFQQIKRYFHVSPPPTTTTQIPLSRWHLKLEPLASLLRTKFQAYVILGQNVSFDEMMVPFSGRSKHTLKMKNKPIKEGFKIWALCDRGYLWDFLFYSCTCGKSYTFLCIFVYKLIYVYI
jgi:hypothetical protein